MGIPLPGAEIHVWTATLTGQEMPVSDLDPEERRRADGYLLPRPRADFVQSRSILRRVLGGYLGRTASSLRFTLGPHGKPALEQGSDLRFNASHSGECLVIAVRRGHPVGVDVERPRDLPNAGALARRFFTAAEAGQIAALPPERRAEGFRALWVLKEAIVKAEGEAMAYHMDRIEAALDPQGAARFLAWHGQAAALQAWAACTFRPLPGYIATLATRGPAGRTRFLDWVRRPVPGGSGAGHDAAGQPSAIAAGLGGG